MGYLKAVTLEPKERPLKTDEIVGIAQKHLPSFWIPLLQWLR